MSTRLLLLLMLASFGVSASLRIADPLLPALVADFDASTAQAALAVTSFAAALGFMQLVWGPLGDRYGKLRLVTWACLFSAFGSAAAALSTSLGWLVLFRLISGATIAAIVPLSMASIGDRVPYEKRQLVLGRYLAGSILGLVCGPFLGGLLADLVSWRAPFVMLATVFGAAGLLLLAEARRDALPPEPLGGRLLASYRAVLSVGWARLILLVVFIEGAAVFGALAFIPTFLHLHFGVSLTVGGGMTALFGIGGLLYSIVVRRWVGRLGEQGLVLGAAPLLGLGFAAPLLLGEAWWPLAPAMVVAGLGFYTLHNTLQTHATQMAPAARGTAVSLYAAFLTIGNAAGVTIASLTLETGAGTAPFLVSAVILFVLALSFRKALQRRSHQPGLAA